MAVAGVGTLAITTAAAGPALAGPPDVGPIFEDGQAQVVPEFSDPDTWIRQQLWVETEFDTDGDGHPDRMHVDVTRPGQTEDGLEVPVVYKTSPYYAGTASTQSQYFWDVRHELGEEPPQRISPPPIPHRADPEPGTELTVDLAATSLELPVVGGPLATPETTLLLNGRPLRSGVASAHPPPPPGYVRPLVTLTGADGWGSGVDRVMYRLDGQTRWITYDGPFRISGAGERTIEYRSIDVNGNTGAVESVTFATS